MKVELPEFKRCCFCMPLRYGLLVWGYLKLMISLLLLIIVTHDLVYCIRIASIHGAYSFIIYELVVAAILLMVILLDISIGIVFLIGGHRKTVKFLRVGYIYSIVILCITTVISVASAITNLNKTANYSPRATGPHGNVYIGFLVYVKIILLFFNFATQSYVILLIKSEINKLLTSTQSFRFQNVAMEAECTLENGSNENGNGNTELDNGITEQKNVTNVQENGTDEAEDRFYGRYDESGGESFNYKKFVHN